MKSTLLVPLLLGVALGGPAGLTAAAGAELRADSKIAQVTVYADRALVTRSATVHLQRGESELLFVALPAGISEDSVSAAIRQGAGRIVGLELQRQFLGEPQNEKIRGLQKELEELGDKQKELSGHAEIHRKQLEFADKLQIYQIDKASKELAIKETKVEEWSRVLGFLEKTRAERLTAQLKIELELRELGRKIQLKQQELGQLSSFRPTETRTAVVHLDARDAGSAEVELRYIIAGASWVPTYDARADADKKDIELTYYGTLTQRTGEDWKDVEVSLSTAHPSVGAAMTELAPTYLTRGQVLGALRPPAAGYGRLQLQSNIQQAAPDIAQKTEADAGWEQAAVESRGTSAIYKVPRRQSIESSDRPHRVTVSIDRFPASLFYATTPKQQPFAFLKAIVRNTDKPFLAGAVNVFLRGDFIGQSRLDNIAPNQEFPIYLGIDERIKVKREQIGDKIRESWLGKKLTLSLSFRTTVENYRNTAQTVYLYDQVPVSRDARIEVKSFRSELPLNEEKPEKGELRWKLELAPGKKQLVEFSYDVVFPEEVVSAAGGKENLRRATMFY